MKKISFFKLDILKQKLEITKYIIIGVISVIIDIVLYFVFVNSFNVSHEVSKKISFCTGAIFSFIGNKYFTFKSNNNFRRQALKFTVLYTSTFLINTITHDLLWSTYQIESIAVGLATIITVIMNYIGQKLFIFNKLI